MRQVPGGAAGAFREVRHVHADQLPVLPDDVAVLQRSDAGCCKRSERTGRMSMALAIILFGPHEPAGNPQRSANQRRTGEEQRKDRQKCEIQRSR